LNYIRIFGAREHNLKNINLKIPRGRVVVITGVSGSGKSSLAFDTIFAEAQRRYMESLSSYARQFVERLDKPDFDSIEGLSPSVSVDQKTFQRNPRSTVGTITEIYDFLRLLFARLGAAFCYNCGSKIEPQTPEAMLSRVLGLEPGTRVSIFSPIVRGRKGVYRKELEELKSQGFLRVKIDGTLYDLDEEIKLDRHRKHTIDVLVDVVVVYGEQSRGRIDESLRLALRLSGGAARVETERGEEMTFSEEFACTNCGVSYPEISPRLFSFNSPYGACEECQGLGVKEFFDPELMIESMEKSIDEGAIIPSKTSVYFRNLIKDVCREFGIDTGVPLRDLPRGALKVIMEGAGEKSVTFGHGSGGVGTIHRGRYEGIVGIISDWYASTESEEIRESLSKYIRRIPCPRCGGSRLRRESLSIKIDGRTIADIAGMDAEGCRRYLESLSFSGKDREVAGRILKEILSRLDFLCQVGLGYLSLDRAAPTLSGGEAQRIRLATQVGAKLTGITYVLDEPTIGLHPRDNDRLLDTLCALRDSGNSVIVVEHDEETMRRADYIVDMGPGAGELGGWVVACGSPEELASSEHSITGAYLAGRMRIEVPEKRKEPSGFVTIKKASHNNLKGIDVSIPKGVFTCVTGVSGSGKSSLVIDILGAALAQRFYGAKAKPGAHEAIDGMEGIDKVIEVDQSPIGRTPRSNPATYTGVFTPIRELFAMLPESRIRGYKPGRFSFNVEGGRCAACRGEGVVKIEMHFLPDVYVKCEECGGKRYNHETLDISYKGRSIADVLDMTVSEAVEFFENIPQVRAKLQVLKEVGLDYVRLGQPATTLSGGEAQRIKLGRELSKRPTGKTLYILDEPTIGLHFDDVKKLLKVLFMLRDRGNTVIVIEHNIDVIKAADWVIDLGPEGGEEGGYIVASGTPEEVALAEGSHTAFYLRRALAEGTRKEDY
jgi:excinuclease ABC subunit A